MDPSEFRRHGHALVEWIADYLVGSERYPVLARVAPGDVRDALPATAPEHGEPFDDIFADFERVLVPALTHWNHPGFFGYFASTDERVRRARRISLGRTQSAGDALADVARRHRTRRGLAWLAARAARPARSFEGVIYDTASISSLHALAAAREAAVPDVREQGCGPGLGPLRIYCSEQAHSSIDKAVLMLGLGHRRSARIPTDDAFRMRVDALRAALDEDRATACTPVAVVGTIGTTSTTGVDPVGDIADICRDRGVWLHVDAAYAGVTAMLPECARTSPAGNAPTRS